nr:ABC.1 [Starmerella bombicola]
MKPIFKANQAVIKKFKTPFSFEILPRAKCAVYGPLKSELLEIIAGKVADPSKRISYPGIGHDTWPSQAIQFTSFGQSNTSNASAPFVGARYESFRDEFDQSLIAVLKSRAPESMPSEKVLEIANQLDLHPFLDNWYVGLSNGQSRRAQLAIALLRQPKMLVMDEPFLGLDPSNRMKFSKILQQLPIPVVIGLRAGDPTPSWTSQLLFAAKDGISEGEYAQIQTEAERSQSKLKSDRRTLQLEQRKASRQGPVEPPIVELRNITIQFPNAETPLFENLSLKAYKGDRIHISGPNGSGKSTLLALLTADHPQSWSSEVFLNGEPLEVGKQSYFSINKQIGHSSPEVHAIFPKYLNTRRAISTGFSSSMFPATQLSAEQAVSIERVGRRLGLDLSDTKTRFGEMPLSKQKLVLFARALVKDPKLLILDEAFSTLSTSEIELAFQVLDEFEGAVFVVGHVENEIPVCDKQLAL